MNLISVKQLDRKIIEEIIEIAKKMEKSKDFLNIAQNKILATLFFEPSTRTRMSFESAMIRLGGKVISSANMMETSSAKKGETLYDTGKIVSSFSDIIVMRHPDAHSVEELSMGSDVPVINAGDGPNEHPTQALLDLYTIRKELNTLDNLHIAFVGDLKYGRTVHSLSYLLKFYKIKISFISPDSLRMPEEKLKILKDANIEFEESSNLKNIIPKVDVLYQTRIQEERFIDKKEYNDVKDSYLIGLDTISESKKSMILLHPLPRVNELKKELDTDKRACYFKQVKNGIPVRMAIIKYLLDI